MTAVQSVGETNEYEKMEKFLLLLDLHVYQATQQRAHPSKYLLN